MKRSKTTPNRKALPKFLKWLLISAVFGFCVGIASGILDDLDVGVWLTDGLIRLLTVIAPWGIPISSVVLLGICLWHYRSAKSLFDRWDGEDDSAPEEADRPEQKSGIRSGGRAPGGPRLGRRRLGA